MISVNLIKNLLNILVFFYLCTVHFYNVNIFFPNKCTLFNI